VIGSHNILINKHKSLLSSTSY